MVHLDYTGKGKRTDWEKTATGQARVAGTGRRTTAFLIGQKEYTTSIFNILSVYFSEFMRL